MARPSGLVAKIAETLPKVQKKSLGDVTLCFLLTVGFSSPRDTKSTPNSTLQALRLSSPCPDQASQTRRHWTTQNSSHQVSTLDPKPYVVHAHLVSLPNKKAPQGPNHTAEILYS